MDKRKAIPKLPAPTRDEFYAWMLERLDLPANTPLTRGFFESSRVLNFFAPGDLRALWWTRGRMNAEEINGHWRTQLSAKLQLKDETGLSELLAKFPFSAQGWQTLGLKTTALAYAEPLRGNFSVRDGMTPGEAFLEAERLLRRDIEIRGRAYVAEKGAKFYLRPLQSVPGVTAHETLETAMRWRELGLFEPHDAKWKQSFPDILCEHALWLSNRKRGKRAQLCGRDLREVLWPKGALRGADLRGAILRNLNLDGDDLRGADLRYADLTAARLANCRLTSARLQGALLDFALVSTWTQIRLADCNEGLWGIIDNGNGVNPVFNYKRALRGDLSGCEMRGRILRHLNNASHFDFTDCDLRGADLTRLNFDNSSRITSFRGADLRGANVWGASFNHCDFTGANLDDLKDAEGAQWDNDPPRARDFRGTKWRGVNLERRNFTDCDFAGANLRGANLSFADFCGANLRDADLRGCKMVQTRLDNADLSGSDLRGVRLRLTKTEGAIFDGARLDKDALKTR